MLRRLEFSRDERAPAAARRPVDDLDSVLDAGTMADARLLVSELVSNSVRDGDGDKVVVLIDAGLQETLRGEVIDDGGGFVPHARQPDSVGGWGLDLVEQLANSWGVRQGSTHVWFELPTGAHART